MGRPEFKAIEKIKTISCTYMAASGLSGEEIEGNNDHVLALTDFALEIREQLQFINEHSFNSFEIRIGRESLRHSAGIVKMILRITTQNFKFLFGGSERKLLP